MAKPIFLFLMIFINHIHGSASTTKEIDGKYYSFHTDKKMQHAASSECKKEGGKLYEPHNFDNYKKIKIIAINNGIDSFWLGIIEGSKKEEFIYQSDRCPIVFNFLLPKSNNYFNKECISVTTVFKSNWDRKQCGSWRLSYVCEKNVNGKFEIWVLNI